MVWVVSCVPQKTAIGIDRHAQGSIGGVALSEAEMSRIADEFADLRTAKREVVGRADYVLVIKSRHGSDAVFSFYFEDGFFHRGMDLDAMTERMSGKDTTGYELNDSLRAVLTAIGSRSDR